jgi:Beta-1,3-glucanase
LLLDIENLTGYPDDQIWFACWGNKIPDAGGKFYPTWRLVDAADGKLVELTSQEGGGYHNLNLNLAHDAKKSTTPHVYSMRLPNLYGGRFYFSIGKAEDALSFEVRKAGPPEDQWRIQPPNGWDKRKTVNYSKLFDWWEFTNDLSKPEQGFNGNTTEVDMTGIPMQFSCTDTLEGTVKWGAKPGARNHMFDLMKADGVFKTLLVESAETKGLYLRALAPYKALDPSLIGQYAFPPDFFDKYIAEVWDFYSAINKTPSKLIAKPFGDAGATWEGQTEAVEGEPKECLVFKSGNLSFYFRKPDGGTVFRCTVDPICGGKSCLNPPAKPDELFHAAARCKGGLNANLNRSTLIPEDGKPGEYELPIVTNSEACKASLARAYKADITNRYSKYVHETAIDGVAYGLALDDNCSASSFQSFRNPSKATVTLLAF